MIAWADNRNGCYMVLLFLARTHRDMRFRKDMARKYERINFGIYNEGNWRKKVCSQKNWGSGAGFLHGYSFWCIIEM